MSSRTLRLATIGTWGHLGDPLAEIAGMAGVQLVAHARATATEDVAYLHQVAGNDSLPWFDDYAQMLEEIQPDVVILSTRIDRINPIAIDAAKFGCHLICEKPLAMNHADLKALYDLAIAKKIQCIAMLGNARHPVMQAASAAISAGKIGDVVLLNARKSYKWGNRPDWFADRKTYGGSITWVAIHGLEMIHHLSGQAFVSVAAMQSNAAHPDRAGCEDNGILVLQLSGGGHASVSFDLLRPTGAATHGDDWVRVVGTTGVIEAHLDRGTCKLITSDAAEVDLPLPPRGGYYVPFLQKLQINPTSPTIEMQNSFMLTDVCLSARDAADQRTQVMLTPSIAEHRV